VNTRDATQRSVETDPHRWIAALRNSQTRLASLVEPLSPEELRGPSYHDWTIAQVLGHMGSQAEIFSAWVTNALEGTDPAGREYMQPIWDAWDARSPDEKATDSLDVNERLVQRFEQLTDGELERMHLNLFGMELDGPGLPRLRLAEHALHAWDIEVALDPTAQIAPDAVDLLIDTLPSLAGRVGKPSEKAARLRVRTSGPVRDFALQLGDAVALTTWGDGANDGELLIPAESFLRLIYGRLDQDHTPAVELTGPVTLDELRAVFPGV
jgi:uncharacterized protein (TIGR03083 family)